VKIKLFVMLALVIVLMLTSSTEEIFAQEPKLIDSISYSSSVYSIAPPILVGAYETPGSAYVGAYDVAVDNRGYAYVADDDAGLRIINVSRPHTPTEIGACDTPYLARGVAVVGQYAYVADMQSGLRIVNVSNPANPVEVGAYDTSWDANKVAIAGNYAYVADGGAGLKVIDVSNPAHPDQVGDAWTPGYAEDVAVASNYAYVAYSQSYWPLDQSGLLIASIISPTHPTQESTFPMAGSLFEGTVGVTVMGNYAYVANTLSGLRIINVSDPANPYEVGFYNTPGTATGVVVNGDYAYVAAGNAGLRIIDVSDPANPVEVSFYDTPGYAAAVSVIGNYVYVADGKDSGLLILWFAPPVVAPVPIAGGSLSSPSDNTTYIFPTNIFTDTVIVTHTARLPGTVPVMGTLIGIDHAFEVTAVYSSTGQSAQPVAGHSYTITVQYSDGEKGPAIEDTLGLYWWDGDEWSQQGITSTANMTNNLVTAQVSHFSLFAVLGETRRVYLPLVLKNH
jgi:hypothetical protein